MNLYYIVNKKEKGVTKMSTQYNIRCIFKGREIFRGIKLRGEVTDEAQQERLDEALYYLNRMCLKIKSLHWVEDKYLKRIAKIYLRNLDAREVARECNISLQTAYNRISDLNNILTERFEKIGLPTVDKIMNTYYQI